MSKHERSLLQAVRDGDIQAAQAALDAGADVNGRDSDKRTPLLLATRNNDVELARILLDSGSDPNAKDLTDAAN